MSNPLNPLYDAVAWVIVHIHAVLVTFISQNSVAWVMSIVILVVVMRLLLVPLFIKQMHSMRKMAALSPHMNELRKKYKNDRQTLNEETMKLYKENGVNPLGGCLPLVAQMPLFFALFSVLRAIAGWTPKSHTGAPYHLTPALIESAQRANILHATLGDKVLFTDGLHVAVSAKVVIVFFVLISVLTTYLTVRQNTKRGMTPQMTPDNPMASSQKMMNYIVPLFALSGLYWAFGLVLYWVTTNTWTLGQQWVLFKRYPPPVVTGPSASPAPAGAAALAPRRPAGTGTAAGTGAKPVPPKAKAAAAKAAQPGGKPHPGWGRGGAPPPSGTASRPAAKPPAGGKAVPAGKPAAAGSRNGQAGRGGQQANGSENGPGLLRRLGRGRAAEEPPEQAPEVKIVRQQPTRQSRSKRSGKR